jgi:hypothetical protein
VELPRGCGIPGACLVRFDLNTEEVGLSELSKWLGSQPNQRRWYQMLTPEEPTSPKFLENLRASGKVSAGRLWIRNVVAERVSAALDLERGKLKIAELRGDVLGGKHRGNWQVDFTAGPTTYTGSGTLTEISLGQIADAMRDRWISGTGGGTYQITASGSDSAAFWESAEGQLQFDLREGVLSHISLASDEGPLRVGRWEGRVRLHGGEIEIENDKLVSSAGTYEISGSASLGRVLDFKLSRSTDVKPERVGSQVYSIRGTLAEPRVVLTSPETQARLKP